MQRIIDFLKINKSNIIHLYELILDFLQTVLRIKKSYDEVEVSYSGLIGDKVDERDYMLGSNESVLLSKKNPYKKLVEFNQYKGIHKWSCTLFSTMGMVNYNTGLGFKQEDVEKYSKQFIDRGIIVPKRGALIRKVIDEFRKVLEKDYNEKVLWYTVNIKDTIFEQALNNGWGFVIGYRTSREKLKDTQEDGIENGCEYPKVGGHAVWVRKNENGELEVINSYKGVFRYNRYKFQEGLKQLRCEVDKGIYFLYARIIIRSEDIKIDPDVRLIEEAIERGITKDKQVLEDIKKGKYTRKVQTVLMIMRAINSLKK